MTHCTGQSSEHLTVHKPVDYPVDGQVDGVVVQGVPDEGHRMISLCVPIWTGLGQGCLRDHFRRAGDLKNEGK